MLAYRAKYIEGLENRLGRMESLLRLSGMAHLCFLVSQLSEAQAATPPRIPRYGKPLEEFGWNSEEPLPVWFIPRIPC